MIAINPATFFAPPDARAAARRRTWLSALVLIAALLCHLACTVTISRLSRFPNGFDELQHLSYARTMATAPALLPRYPVGPTLKRDGTGWSEAPNYLNHPSPYYLVMGAIDRLAGGDVGVLRAANIALSTLAMGLTLAGGFMLLEGAGARALFAAALIMFPKTAVVGAIVNNDNGALLATGLAMLGLGVWVGRSEARRGAALIAAALVVAGWTKLTAFVSLVAVLAALSALTLRAGAGRARSMRAAVRITAPVLGALAVGSVPTFANLVTYGRALWRPTTFWVAPAMRQPLDLPGYAALFVEQLGKGWGVLEPAPLVNQAGLVVALAVAGVTAAHGLRRRTDGVERVAAAFMLALVPVLAMHFAFGWQAVQEDGYRDAAQVRYYYVLWPGVALALALLPRVLPTALPQGAARAAAPLTVLAALAPAWPLVMVLRLWARGWPPLV